MTNTGPPVHVPGSHVRVAPTAGVPLIVGVPAVGGGGAATVRRAPSGAAPGYSSANARRPERAVPVIDANVPVREPDVRKPKTSALAGLNPGSRFTATVPPSVAAPVTASTSKAPAVAPSTSISSVPPPDWLKAPTVSVPGDEPGR